MYRRTERFVLAWVIGAGLISVLPASDSAAETPQQEWKCLFDGEDLSAWQQASGKEPSAGWAIEDGALVRKGRGGYLWTKERFGDFVLDLEFKTEGNSGVFFRTDDLGNAVQTGMEVQILEPRSSPSKHSCGAIYDCLAPTQEATKAGQWNHMTLTAEGSHIAIVMNGEQIIDTCLDKWTEPNKNPDGTQNKFRTALKDFKREGHIGLQDHGKPVAYRNIRVKPLDKR